MKISMCCRSSTAAEQWNSSLGWLADSPCVSWGRRAKLFDRSSSFTSPLLPKLPHISQIFVVHANSIHSKQREHYNWIHCLHTVYIFKHTKTQKALLAEKNHKDTTWQRMQTFFLSDETLKAGSLSQISGRICTKVRPMPIYTAVVMPCLETKMSSQLIFFVGAWNNKL